MRSRPVVLSLGLFFCLAVSGPAVSQSDAPPAGAPGSDGAPTRLALVDRPAPDFELTTIAGEQVSLEHYRGYILLLFFFDNDSDSGASVAATAQFFIDAGEQQDVRYLGISTLPSERLREFAAEEYFTSPMASDPDGAVTRAYLGDSGGAAFIIDGEGQVRFFLDRSDRTSRTALRRELTRLVREARIGIDRLPSVQPPWRSETKMPGFFAKDLNGKVHTSRKFAGKPLVIYFFEEGCVHCRESTPLVRDLYHKYGEKGLQFVGVVSKPTENLANWLRDAGFRFPVLVDPAKRVHQALGSVQGNPDILLVDAEGVVRWRELGAPDNLWDILDIEAAVLTGAKTPSGLPPGKYMGFRYCRVCHQGEFEDWLETPHAVAMMTLHEGKAFRNDECLSCHVTGFQRPGGFADLNNLHLTHVQCEACHGAGGPHGTAATPAVKPDATCLTCHIAPYLLKQSLDVSLSWVDHKDTPGPDVLFAYHPSQAEESRKRRLTSLAGLTFEGKTEYVGSDRCASCHAAEHAAWVETAHARSVESLRRDSKDLDRECLRCHVTGQGTRSGYRGPSSTSLAAVGCEACHGPGGDHVDAPAEIAAATIYGLAPDCDTCQPEPVCRTCHDAENDADFRMPADAAASSHATTP